MQEIQTQEQLEAALAAAESGDRSMRDWQVQDVDLGPVEARLHALDPRGALFLGSPMSDELADRLRAGGALVFPALPDLPFDPWRSRLYTPEELYSGLDGGYARTPDARIYTWSLEDDGTDLKRLLSAAIHDSSVDDALAEYVASRGVVGIMGGHALARTDPAYLQAARLGHALAATGLTVATGGGPGAMEAANLGARLADEDVAHVDAAVRAVAAVPDFRPDVTAWAQAAVATTADHPDSGRSLGVPTWFYGHEPPNAFASVVAKYFRNAIREDVLLETCRRGIVFLPGAAGTVQEVFQAACTNYYAQREEIAPMVFVGSRFWAEEQRAWPLLLDLAGDGPLREHVHLVDDPDEAVALLRR